MDAKEATTTKKGKEKRVCMQRKRVSEQLSDSLI